ncbi:MAG: hypothetical protein Q8N26_19270 [Myxococcales bacterium]|nr:hypothetical protein [Myxococcales bacterium]
MRWLVVVLLGAAGCSRCSREIVVDAGAPVVVVKEAKRFSTDLRTVLLTIYPEYRGTTLREGVARLTRTLVGQDDWAKRAHELYAKNRVTETPADAGVEGTLDLFRFRIAETPGGATAVIELPVDGETMGKLYTNPASLSSMQLGQYLPREGVTIERDVFDFRLEYDASTEKRATFLSRQLVELMLGNGQWKAGPLPSGWEPNPGDGGYGEVPGSFVVTLTGVVDGATVKLTRDGSRINLEYRLVTFQR